ncbi:hypothetical protein NBRC10512v2_006069 [Rhodotorula toruloides]
MACAVRLLRDSFANYVVQTALDYAEPAQRAQLVETIRPILPMIRNTPYGKRIQSKIQRETNEHMGHRGGFHGHHHHGPQFIPAGGYYGVPTFNGPPPHYPPHLAHGMHAPPPHAFGEYARAGSPYLGQFAGYPPAMLGGPMGAGPNGSLPGGPGAAGQQAGAGFAPYAQAGPGAGDFVAPSSQNAHGGLPSTAGYSTFAM